MNIVDLHTVVSIRIPLSAYKRAIRRAERWGLLFGTGRPNVSATLCRLIEAGLEATAEANQEERMGKESANE
jgi:hypothetical protein